MHALRSRPQSGVMNDERAPIRHQQPRNRFEKIHEQHALQAFLFATKVTGDPVTAGELTDEALVKLGGRFADLRHPDSFGQDLRRTIVRLASSRRSRGSRSKKDVRTLAAAVLRTEEGLELDQIAAVLDISTKRAAQLVERGSTELRDIPQHELITYPEPSDSLLKRWRFVRIRTLLIALIVLEGSGIGAWRIYVTSNRTPATTTSASAHVATPEQRPPLVAARIPLTGSRLEGLFPYNGPGEMAAADGMVWIAGHFGVVGVSTATNEIAHVVSRSEGIGFGGGLAASQGAVLVAQGNSALIEPPGGAVRIEPGEDREAASFALQGVTLPHGLAVGGGSGWLAALNIGIYRLDLATMEPLATIPLPNPQAVEVGYGAVWAIDGEGAIAKIDLATDSVVAQVQLNGYDLAVGENGVWVLGSGLGDDDQMSQPPGLASIDPNSGEIRWFKPMTAQGITAGAGAVWALEHDRSINAPSTLRKIDPRTGEIVAALDLGDISAVDLCVLDGSVWVLDRLEPSLIRVDV